MIRIRYTKDLTTGLYHTKPIFAGMQFVVVNLEEVNPITQNPVFTITSYDTGRILIQGGSDTLARAKALVKKQLIALGAVFDDEIRQRKDSNADDRTFGLFGSKARYGRS
jgi:hypothetical protein